jgi:major vault protein
VDASGAGANPGQRERDLVLAPNEYAYIADETKGNINVYVGPHKTSLANTDRPVVFNRQSKRFDRCSLEQAVQTLAVAPEGWYLVLKNPAHDGSHPKHRGAQQPGGAQVGRKVNLPGPVAFALWPGQMARVIQGHHLRSNQYLVVRVYDEEAAKTNWKNAVIKPQTSRDDAEPEIPEPARPHHGQAPRHQGHRRLVLHPAHRHRGGARRPGGYVREAVTLERLEYCILLDERRQQALPARPAVVFPRPTEVFVQRGGARKFRAIELSENSGIYVKVIAPTRRTATSLQGGRRALHHRQGPDDLLPAARARVVKYGDQEIHYAVAIPAGEGRYVLDRNSGQIRLQRGPCIFLPDPRREVIVRRVLDRRQVELWFPGNAGGAVPATEKLARSGEGGHLALSRRREPRRWPLPPRLRRRLPPRSRGDDFTRSQTYNQPRTIVLDTATTGRWPSRCGRATRCWW